MATDLQGGLLGDAAASQTLADQALENLVNQFARPLDFLRELVQNSIDAGSPRVDVWLSFSAPAPGEVQGVVEIHVDDFGEGMDEQLIDTQLTRMFSSTKEDDLTKIGKFGIGFTSIFAIRPDAVLLRTGRHGESWELLFHPDRSFEKIRLDVPATGTRITLFKKMSPAELDGFVRECRWVLSHWCEHSNTPISFWDRTRQAQTKQAEEADPFAAFAEPAPEPGEVAGPERITRPMELEATLSVRLSRDGVEAVVGYAEEPRYGFYNGGLTLLNTRSPDALGVYAPRLSHLAFKLKSDKLEHTLTRDNVLQDNHWRKAMEVLGMAAAELRRELLRAVESAIRSDAARRADLYGWLAAECRASQMHQQVKGFAEVVRLPVHGGGSVTLAEVEAQEDEVGAVLLAPPAEALSEALKKEGLHLLLDLPEVRDLLDATWKPPLLSWGRSERRVERADHLFIQPQLIDPSTLPPAEQLLFERTAALLKQAARGRIRLRVGAFGGPDARDEALALEGPAEGGLFQRPQDTWFRLPAFLRRRCLLLNRHHPAFRAQVVAAAEDPDLAAFALAQAVLHVEGIEGEGAFDALVEAATSRLVEGAA